MKVKLKASHLRLVGKKINSEGQWTEDHVLDSWALSLNADRDLVIYENVVERRVPAERKRVDRKDVRLEVTVNAIGGVVPIVHKEQFITLQRGMELSDEAPEPKPAAKAYLNNYTARLGDVVYGPFGTYDQASDFANNRLGPGESWTSGTIRVPVE